MIERNTYMQQIGHFANTPLIKIITGIRRCGKSSVLMLFKDRLLNTGVNPEQIIYINFESFQYTSLKNADSLYRYISENIQKDKKNYIILDEIQEVENWEKCINSLLIDFDTDIYLTGSNSHILSSELATYIAGRYVEIPVYTLSFREYLSFKDHYKTSEEHDVMKLCNSYIRQGGFPVIHLNTYTYESSYKIIYDIYSSIILRDTVQRYKIRDIELLERVINYVLNNIGNTFSGKNVADYFKSQQRKIDINTVYNYLYALEGSFVLYRTPRYDIKGKEILKTQEKFYLSDVSLLYATMGFKDSVLGGVLENIVFLELKRRGYKVFVGKLNTREIDFIAEKSGTKIYVQVAYKLESQQTIDREFSILRSIKDHYPKFVITMDEFWKESIDGIQHYYISDFLLSDKF